MKKFSINQDCNRKPLEFITKDSVCCEIGVWLGEFTSKIIEKSPKKVYLIDPWLFQPSFNKNWYGGSLATNQKDMDDIFNHVEKKFKYQDNIEFIRKTSDEAFNYIENESLDWIYIDGNHAYEYVLKDLINSYNKTKKGGYICGDDYYYPNNTVKNAVAKLCNDKNLKASIYGSQFVIKKL